MSSLKTSSILCFSMDNRSMVSALMKEPIIQRSPRGKKVHELEASKMAVQADSNTSSSTTCRSEVWWAINKLPAPFAKQIWPTTWYKLYERALETQASR